MSKLKKILTVLSYIFLKWPVYFLSKLIPKNKNVWVFSGDKFFDNSKYLFININEQEKNKKNIRPIWISSSSDTVNKLKNMGFEAYEQNSFKGYIMLFRAHIHIISHFVGTPFWTMGGAKYVNLWHGIPLKNLHFKSRVGVFYRRYSHPFLRWVYRPFSLLQYKKPDLMLSTSPMVSERFKECFKLKDSSIVESIYPRCEILFLSKTKIIDYINRYEDISTSNLVDDMKSFKKVYIYMPTWRNDSQSSFGLTVDNLIKLNELMKKQNAVFLFKFHPLTSMNKLEVFKGYSNFKIINNNIDIYPILPFTDTLITDYSSIYFDYLLLDNRRVIHYTFDYYSYIKNDFDIEWNFDEIIPEKRVDCFDDLFLHLANDVEYDQEKYLTLRNKFWVKQADKIEISSYIGRL